LPRHLHALGTTDRDGLDSTGAVDQQTDAPVDVPADRRQLARQLVGDDRARRNAPAIESLESMFVGGRQT